MVESGNGDCDYRLLYQILSLLPQTSETRHPFQSSRRFQIGATLRSLFIASPIIVILRSIARRKQTSDKYMSYRMGRVSKKRLYLQNGISNILKGFVYSTFHINLRVSSTSVRKKRFLIDLLNTISTFRPITDSIS